MLKPSAFSGMHEMHQLSILLLICTLSLCGCTAYYITPEELAQQLRSSTAKSIGSGTSGVYEPAAGVAGVTRYLASGLEKILCRKSSGELVYLYPDENTQLAITSKSTGEVTKIFFHTVYLEGNVLKGVRSRIMTGVVREVPLSDIERIEIYSEMTKVEKAGGGKE